MSALHQIIYVSITIITKAALYETLKYFHKIKVNVKRIKTCIP